MIFRLIYLNGPHKGERITVTREPLTIGRSQACGVYLPEDPEAADHHCTVTHSESDELRIRDNGSMNRVLVNHHEVTDSKLKHGDMIEIGRTRFLVQAFVQAEVNRAAQKPEQQRRPSRVKSLAIILLALAVAAALAILALQTERKPVEPGTPPPDEIIPPSLFKDIPATQPVSITNSLTNTQASVSNIQSSASNTLAPASNTQATASNTQAAASSSAAGGIKTNEAVTAVKPPPPKKPAEPPKPEVPPPIIITSLSQQKFPLKAEYDEMRMASLTLRTTGAVIDNEKVAVKFDFYDRDLTTGEILPARAIVEVKAMRVTELASSGEETITATYTVPKGLRDAPSASSAMTFYGVHVKVMYAGELVAEKAIPSVLMNRD